MPNTDLKNQTGNTAAQTTTTATKKKTSVPPDKLRLYEQLIASVDGIDAKSNFGSAYTAINGNMYSMISKYGVVGIRLPEPQRSAFLDKYHASIFRADPSWPPSKEYVAVPDDLLNNTKALRPYLERSYQHALSLRPKAAKAAKADKPDKAAKPDKADKADKADKKRPPSPDR